MPSRLINSPQAYATVSSRKAVIPWPLSQVQRAFENRLSRSKQSTSQGELRILDLEILSSAVLFCVYQNRTVVRFCDTCAGRDDCPTKFPGAKISIFLEPHYHSASPLLGRDAA